MPYFHNKDVNLLYIHIPKTGGTSIEYYLGKKCNIPLNEESLCEYDFFDKQVHDRTTSRQHMTYIDIMKNKHKFNIDDNKLFIFASIRNPYDRAISDLFYLFPELEKTNDKNYIYTMLSKKIIENVDNHSLPQYKFVINEQNVINEQIIIIHTESLSSEMKKIGFDDFNEHKNKNKIKHNYLDYLNKKSIDLINKYYEHDFKLFGYDMIYL